MRWFHYSAHGAGKLTGPAFSGSFIVDQKQLELPYGRYGSAAAGCGWIAVYNALQILGIDADMEKIRSDMEKLLFLGGWRATPFYVPALYFRHKGFRVRLTANRSQFSRQARKYPAGILFYLYHQKGKIFPSGHFAAFAPTSDGQCHFYNDIPGMSADIRSMKQFFEDRPAFFMVLTSFER